MDIAQKANAEITIEGDCASYSRARDCVFMPDTERFFDTRYANVDVGFASVLGHELTHWTGHVSRLDRGIHLNKGNSEYAYEDLIAELGSAFVCSDVAFQYNGLDEYVWIIYKAGLRLLGDDNKAFFRGSSSAMKAKQFLIRSVKEGKWFRRDSDVPPSLVEPRVKKKVYVEP